MATPYFQLCLESVPSTQDVARDNLGELPVLVMSPDQSKGRGRAGDEWITAERAVAVSLAFKCKDEDTRPFSLMAGVAATQVAKRTRLKWPNDVMLGDLKVGGILVERSADVVVVGLGLNLWWPDPPEGMAGLLGEDPGDDRYAEVAGLWGAEFMLLMDSDGWPIDQYRSLCITIGMDITWDPDGAGRAIGVDEDGGLVVETDAGRETISSGVVRHVRFPPQH
ncbi:MAG: biotin--[acetyl-CoA-carboxylase] ligase [Acidimicrobiia bacterium]